MKKTTDTKRLSIKLDWMMSQTTQLQSKVAELGRACSNLANAKAELDKTRPNVNDECTSAIDIAW